MSEVRVLPGFYSLRVGIADICCYWNDREVSVYFAYVLQNQNGRFYIGHTDNLERRLTEHNTSEGPRSKYTLKNGPWKLVWSESYPDRSSAVRRERQIKAMKSARWIRENLLSQELQTP